MEYGTSKGVNNPFLVLESAWHKPQWSLVKDALSQVEQGCPKELVWKLHLYRGKKIRQNVDYIYNSFELKVFGRDTLE